VEQTTVSNISLNGPGTETFVVMSATMPDTAKTATTEPGKGIPDRVIIQSLYNPNMEYPLLPVQGPKALFIVLAKPGA